MAVDPYQRRDCGPGADNATCLAKGCCYDDAYYGGAPGCFYNSSMCRSPCVLIVCDSICCETSKLQETK